MDRDEILEIGIDDKGRLYIAPKVKTFPFIYREAKEVHWDEKGFLLAPAPPRSQLAEPIWWFQRIISVAREQACELVVTAETKWNNVPVKLKNDILSFMVNANV